MNTDIEDAPIPDRHPVTLTEAKESVAAGLPLTSEEREALKQSQP